MELALEETRIGLARSKQAKEHDAMLGKGMDLPVDALDCRLEHVLTKHDRKMNVESGYWNEND